MSWNLAAIKYSQKSVLVKILGYVCNCIFIDRGLHNPNVNNALSSARYILEHDEVVTIFPEGRRSQSGKFEVTQLKSGVSKIISKMSECRVLCVHLHSDKKNTSVGIPSQYSKFTIKTELIHFKNSEQDNKPEDEILNQIGQTIYKMEQQYVL